MASSGPATNPSVNAGAVSCSSPASATATRTRRVIPSRRAADAGCQPALCGYAARSRGHGAGIPDLRTLDWVLLPRVPEIRINTSMLATAQISWLRSLGKQKGQRIAGLFEESWWAVQVSNLRPQQCEWGTQVHPHHRGPAHFARPDIIILVECLSNSLSRDRLHKNTDVHPRKIPGALR